MNEAFDGRSFSRRSMLTGTLAAAAAVGATLVPGGAVARATASKYPFPTGKNLTVLVTGDAGTGAAGQLAVAEAAKKLFAVEQLSLAIGLGDNIYEDGAETPDDDEFGTKFEAPNTGLDVPWLMALGNHDNSLIVPGDGSWLEKGNNEVGYHARSPRWWMPSRYYSVALPANDPVVEFFVLDLNPLCSYIPQILNYWAPNGPYMTGQREWLRQSLASSPAKWKITCNHFPYIANGPHGNAGAYDGVPALLPHANGTYAKEFFDQEVLGRVPILLAGHDHSQQVLTPTAATKGAYQIVSGAAAKSVGGQSRITNPALHQDFSNLGFMVLDISPSSVAVRVYTVDIPSATARLAFQQLLAGT
ncbi:metallophosphoesterase [Antrihabitans sp. NCIMB 15449]|uniref:Metallophosphoesterase n=1 Tax=Antrihabitans spumae TaxID=3373370 RepID=A0ABW7JVI9_9NOCA